jgi:predicted sugar kinase
MIMKKLLVTSLISLSAASMMFADADTQAASLSCKTHDVSGYYMKIADTEPKWAYLQDSTVLVVATGAAAYEAGGLYSIGANIAGTVSADGKSVTFGTNSVASDAQAASLSETTQTVAGYYIKVAETEPKWVYVQGTTIYSLATASKAYEADGFFDLSSKITASVSADGTSVSFGGADGASCSTAIEDDPTASVPGDNPPPSIGVDVPAS